MRNLLIAALSFAQGALYVKVWTNRKWVREALMR